MARLENLSSSEKRTLKQLAEGEHHASEFDWVALQRLKRLGLAEERSTGMVLTKEGRRVLQHLVAGTEEP
jgi:ribosomal protein S19E (S16A)